MSSPSSAPAPDPLTRRERQIMDVVYAKGSATAREIQELMPDPPSYATVRTLLRVLERKRHLNHRVRGKAFVYEPRRPAESAARSALRRLLNVFFNNSIEQALSGLLDLERSPLSRHELDRLERLIKRAKRQTADNHE
jgi:predicted transcriptional regulator